ncbi:hypothetical protein [Winogradskyella poriferorum]|uniref:Lipocalin-like domain-containing protein n=1 Tax=Winogradskyella poriferorum TaxID=307627 RepID=A0ABU7W8E8_9FLAO
MKFKFSHLFVYVFVALLTFTACQDEAIDINNPAEQEMIQPNTPLANFMGNVTANYADYDNFLDESSCFSVELPVTIVMGDVTIVVETLDDLEDLEDLFEQYENEDDFFDFVFPITIIFNNYSEVVIENEDQLEDFIEDCELEDDEVIECVDFVYPITFSVFNADFNIVDTITITSDEALYSFLEGLEEDDNALVVSINYPVSLVYANGNTIEVNSNQELSDAIEAAEDDCDDSSDDCDINLDELENLLLECGFEAEFYNEAGELENTLQLHFDESGSVTITGDSTVVETGDWEVIETDLGYKLVIEGLETFGIANGLWLLTDCDDDDEDLEFKKETDNGFVTMKLELDCEGSLDCDAQEVALNLKECEWWIGTDLLSPNYNGPLNFQEGGAVIVGSNSGNEVTGTWEVLLGNTGVFLVLDLPGDYQVLSLDWRFVECEDDRLELVSDNNELVLEQSCDVESDCNQSDVSEYLMSCYIVPTINGYTSPMTYFEFSENNSLFTLYQGDMPHNGTWDISSDDNGVFIFIDFPSSIDQYNGQWYLQDCDDDGLVFNQGDNILILACDENVSGAFDCFEDREVVMCDDDNDGSVAFDLNAIYDCPEDNVTWTFYESLMDAEAETNALISPFVNTTNPQIIYMRVGLADNPSVSEIFTVELIVEDCSNSCSEEDVDGFLVECIWNAVNYNGSDNLLNWNFDFEPNSQNVIIYNNETTIDATWTTSQSEDGVIVTFSNVAGPNIQAITGEWLVVECEEDRLQLHSGDNILVLEQTCE